MTQKDLKKAEELGYLVTAAGRIIDIDKSKLLKKGEISSREWKAYYKFLLKFALFEFFVVLMVFMVVEFNLRIAQ